MPRIGLDGAQQEEKEMLNYGLDGKAGGPRDVQVAGKRE